MKLAGAKVVVVGMARSGVAAVELLREQGAEVRAVDQNPVMVPGLTVMPQTEASFADADLIVLSPGVPADLDVIEKRRRRGVRVIGDLELASWFLRGRNHRHHRLQRQDHDDGAHRSHPASRAAFRRRWAATSARRRLRW